MHIDTRNNNALELLKDAQGFIQRFQQSKERATLDEARVRLERALQRDENYLRARFWKGLVNDMLGKTQEAVDELQKVKTSIATIESASLTSINGTRREREIRHFYLTVEFNLGVARYHQYSWEKLEEGIKDLKNVIEKTTNEELKYLSKAWMAKAYAQRMIPKIPPQDENRKNLFEGEDAFEKITKYLESDERPRQNTRNFFISSKEQSDQTIQWLETNDAGDQGNEIKGLVYDARAVAVMFDTDFFDQDRINRLEKALADLNEANRYRPNDWAIYCNFGSVNMRLGYWRKLEAEKLSGEEAEKLKSESVENFSTAHKYLDRVLTTLRPGYGFAFYEKGRAYRLEGKFGEAIHYFDKSLSVAANRDVSEERLEFERNRAKKSITVFP